MKLVLLGTGTPIADPSRSGPAVAVVVEDRPYIVDCGPGIVRRAAALIPPVTRLERAFITHLHSDHTVGYPDLIFTPWTMGREEPLQVWGPSGLGRLTEKLLEAYDADLRERCRGLEPANVSGWQVEVNEIEPGPIYADDLVQVEAFPVKHGAWPAFGYKFSTAERTIVISGDTAPCETLVEQASGCDILLHEVYSAAGFERCPPEWQRYHSEMHASAPELAELATRAEPGLLVLYHQLFWGTSEEDLLAEISDRYQGEVVSGHDGDCF
jgi:ribonuclease BN (tRNA processing enzyme)